MRNWPDITILAMGHGDDDGEGLGLVFGPVMISVMRSVMGSVLVSFKGSVMRSAMGLVMRDIPTQEMLRKEAFLIVCIQLCPKVELSL